MLSVIIPVKDPEPFYPMLVMKINFLLNKLSIENEILIQKELGLTNAVVEGVKKAQYPFVLVMDADGSHDPLYIPVWLNFMHEVYDYDLVVGFKDVDESSFFRKTISKTFRFLGRILVGTKVKDPMSGFVMGRKKMFDLIKPSMDYKFLLQILIHDPRVLDYPIRFYKRKSGRSKASLITGLRTLAYMFRLGFSRRKIK